MAKEHIKAALIEAREALDALIAADETQEAIVRAAQSVAQAIREGKKILSCGNGGSLCDAMHFAEEMTGRLRQRCVLTLRASGGPRRRRAFSNHDFGDKRQRH